MNIFISQKVFGIDRDVLREETKKIAETLENKGHKVFYVIDYPKEFLNLPVGERLKKCAFKEMDKSDTILAIIRNSEKSEGMLMEIGHVLDTNKKIILAVQKEIQNTYLRQIAHEVIEFNDSKDLFIKMEEL